MEIEHKKKTLTTTIDHVWLFSECLLHYLSQMEIISVFVLALFSLDVTNYPET